MSIVKKEFSDQCVKITEKVKSQKQMHFCLIIFRKSKKQYTQNIAPDLTPDGKKYVSTTLLENENRSKRKVLTWTEENFSEGRWQLEF